MTAIEAAIAQESSLSIRGALLWGAQVLGEVGLENHRLDAEVLLRHVLDVEKEQLYLNADAPISAGQEAKFRELLLRRSRREPVAYITGHKEFWSLDFIVTPAVLIPRPETELLVEVALQHVREFTSGSSVTVLDVGTGSGVISVCLAKEEPVTKIVAVDISPVALDVARLNAGRHGVADRIRFLSGDLFAPVKPVAGTFDVIVSNPPYIPTGDLAMLAPEIRQWEPIPALDGGARGIDAYRRIIGEGHNYLAPGGSIVLEIGADMGSAVAEFFSRSGCYGPVSLYQDYAGKDRVIAAMKLLSPNAAPKSADRG
ncbi:MAG TPA: peptide chain release factor N(5)-glutamine methyltransferase [Candidatus Binatia bacterium]|nr:peptide chain release factor N(5)-glutamine methyltransferase [Candidatus Binatia bacterium]